jgi:hypothetical protein
MTFAQECSAHAKRAEIMEVIEAHIGNLQGTDVDILEGTSTCSLHVVFPVARGNGRQMSTETHKTTVTDTDPYLEVAT